MSASTADNTLFQLWTRERDAHAFAAIVERHSGMVYGVCRRVLGNAADAEDVAQECFVELAQTRRAVKHSLAGWLHALAVARSLDRIRSDKRRKAREARFVSGASTQREASRDEVWTEVDEAIASLPERLREPIVYRFLETQSQEAVAQRLGTSRSTVQRRLDQGIERIRAFLRRRGIAAPIAGLVAAFEAHTADAVPPALAATLGKIALSGGAGSAGTASAASGLGLKTSMFGGGIGMTAKATIGIAALLVALMGWWGYSSVTSEAAEPSVALATGQLPSASQTPSGDSANDGMATPVPPNDQSHTAEAASVAAARPPEDTDGPASQKATLRGRVVDSRGVPVGGGRLGVRYEESGSGGSVDLDESGNFEALDLAPGRYSCTSYTYRADDHGLHYGFSLDPPQETLVKAGELREDVVVSLNRPVGRAVLRLRVVDGAGKPIARAFTTIAVGTMGATSGPLTNAEGRYCRYHVPDWESEARVTVRHVDFVEQKFIVPISEEESVLVLEPKAVRAFRMTVVDGKTGAPIPEAAFALDSGSWQPTEEGSVAFAELSLAEHSLRVRAPGYQPVWEWVSVSAEEEGEALIELFAPAKVRVEITTAPSMISRPYTSERLKLVVREGATRRYPSGKDLWDGDHAVTRSISAGHPCDFAVRAKGKTHAEDWQETVRLLTVSGLVVEEGKEALVRCAVGNGTCVLRVPQVEGLHHVLLYRDEDLPGVEIDNAVTHTGVSEKRTIRANADSMFVAGELYPGTYRLAYGLPGSEGPKREEQLVTFSRENEEVLLHWE